MVAGRSFKRFCIVGIGNHCKKNIIPALISIHKQIIGIVTTQIGFNIGVNTRIFSNIDDAINNLPKDTVFILSTPPKYHVRDILKIVKSNRHVYVEKPILVENTYLNEIVEICLHNNLVLVEMFMYKHTEMYKKFIEIWNKNLCSIEVLEIKFFIPSIPNNTFRTNKDIFDSSIFDIGCYPLSLLAELDINLTDLSIESAIYNNDNDQSFMISDHKSKIKTIISFGVGYDYQNYVNVKLEDNKEIRFRPFFYGKSTLKTIEDYNYDKTTITKSDVFTDNNGFKKMFDQNNDYWLINQNKRFQRIKEVTNMLEQISSEVKKKLY